MSPRRRPSPRQRLEVLAEQTLARLEADAKAGKPAAASELNGLRRLLDGIEKERRQGEHLERLNALTRG